MFEEETSKFPNQYLDINPNITTVNFRGVASEDLHISERLAEVIFRYLKTRSRMMELWENLLIDLCEVSVPQLNFYVTTFIYPMSQM